MPKKSADENTEAKRKVGRPRKEIDKEEFEKLCDIQCTAAEICAFFNCSDDSLRRWCMETYGMNFADTYKKKSAGGKTSLRRAQFKLAQSNPTMAIFLGKQYLGQRDVVDMAASDGSSSSISDAIWRELMNPAYADHLTDNRPLQIYFGGASSGKSFAILGQRTIRDMLKGDRNYLICRKTAKTIRNSCFNEIKKCISRMELGDSFSINKTDMVITNKLTGRQILFAGLDDVEKVKSITPETGVLTDIVIEEATEIEYTDFKQLQKRLRGGDNTPKRVTLLFNPVLQESWIYKEFFAGKFDDSKGSYTDDGITILRTTYRDNRYLTREDAEKLEGETDKYYYEVYTLGHWGVLGKLILTNWVIEDIKDKAKAESKARNGLDFGFFPDPNAYVRCGYNRGKKEVYIYKTDGGNYQDNEMLARMLKPSVRNELVTCDNDQLNIHELNNFGIRAIPARKGPDSVEFGLKWLQRMKLIVDPSCVDIILELKKYKYKEDKDGNILPQPVDRDNHWIDALRYALEEDMLEQKVS